MKRSILLAVLLSTSSVYAGGHWNPIQPSSIAGASANSHATATGVGVGVGVGVGGLGGAGGMGGVGGNVSINNPAPDFGDLRIVPPAIAPSVNTNIICPMVMQGSKAGSVFFFSGSGTHAPDIVPLCVAWHLGQRDVVERMACQSSDAYRKANPNCVAQ